MLTLPCIQAIKDLPMDQRAGVILAYSKSIDSVYLLGVPAGKLLDSSFEVHSAQSLTTVYLSRSTGYSCGAVYSQREHQGSGAWF